MRYDELYEQVLILRCQTRDKDAIAELIRRYERPLRYFIGRLVSNRDTAEDLFQETWLKVIRMIATLKETDHFAGWLYRIARNAVYQSGRDRKSYDQLDPEIPDGTDVENEAIRADDVAKLHRCLDTLSPKHKEVLILQFLEDMSYQQMAYVLDCGVGTVRSRLFYAKQFLKQEMEK